MAKRTKMPTDLNQRAKAIMELATAETEVRNRAETDAATVNAKRRGGKAGGRARAEKLTEEQRRAIAQKAASARWSEDSSRQ